MIKEILVILIILSIGGLVSAKTCRDCYVVVQTPIYKDSNLVVTWYYDGIPSTGNIGLHIFEQHDDGNLITKYYAQTINDGSTTISNSAISGGLLTGYNYYATIGRGNSQNGAESSDAFRVESTPVITPDPTPVITPDPTPVITPDPTPVITPIIIPPKPRPFSGYTFGTNDCERMAILMGQEQNRHTIYTMEALSWEYKYNISEMIHYCERCDINMTPITSGFYEWTP